MFPDMSFKNGIKEMIYFICLLFRIQHRDIFPFNHVYRANHFSALISEARQQPMNTFPRGKGWYNSPEL
ncbi:MAG: hypothetical protein N838_28840 [Thiohalocapsa sp. PB-PSB1]|nr:MAG: hypothetical protein N838_28840 [Thiohalocapsa sp. PB-PSB1]